MPYIKLIITATAEQTEQISDLLTEQEALSISVEDAQDQALFQIEPEETPLWQHTKISALFSEKTITKPIIQQLQKKISKSLDITQETVKDEDWVRLTQEYFKPQFYGNSLCVCPKWCDDKDLSGTIVKIDPGLAFGTGTHATTALCLDWLAHNPPKDKELIDYGCGSGILSLAALALGAKEVWAVDHDAQALEATGNNAQLNPIAKNKLHILSPDAVPDIKAPIVIANILANPLIQLAPVISKLVASKGQLILSGILEEEAESVVKTYGNSFTLQETKIQEQWVRLALLKL